MPTRTPAPEVNTPTIITYDPNPARVLLIGDAHGDLDFLSAASNRARRLGITTLVQLGDLGALWPGSDGWLTKLDRILAQHGIDRIVFIDGNHEGWTSHVAFQGSTTGGGLHRARLDAPVTPEGFRALTPRVHWADRATRWEWQGIRFGALGGAFSIDWRARVDGFTWWSDLECPTDEEADRLIEGGPLDVLLTHDAPLGGPLDQAPPLPRYSDTVRSEDVRRIVRRVVNHTTPGLVCHGHWHHRYSHDLTWMHTPDPDADTQWTHVKIEGLAANINPFAEAVAVLNLTGGTATLEAAT